MQQRQFATSEEKVIVMKNFDPVLGLVCVVALLGDTEARAETKPYHGPFIGVEAGYESYQADPGEAITASVIAGYDHRVADRWVLGIQGRFTVKGASESEQQTSGSVVTDTRVKLENHFGISARAGYLVSDNLVVFGEGGYERFDVNAVRERRNQVCAPPTNNCLISRDDFSFDEDMWTVGGGVEIALTDNLRLRGTYTYGEGSAFNRHRLGVAASFEF